MPKRQGSAVWRGSLTEGEGTVRLGSGAFEGPYSFKSRFVDGPGTNPEELIGAAHAGCFSMALSKILTDAGHPPESVETTAAVHLDKVDGGFAITRVHLTTTGRVPGVDAEQFAAHARTAKDNCPVSKALAAIDVSVDATLA